MTRFIIIRFLQTLISLFFIVLLVFFMIRLSGNPADMMVTPITTREQHQHLIESFGLDKPLSTQLWIFVSGAVTGDFGDSYVKRIAVTEIIGNALPNTLKIGVPSFIIGYVIAILLGVVAAVKRDSIWDNGVKFLALLGQALPPFWVGIMAMLVFSLYWKVLPSGGLASPKSYILPVGTMLFFFLPGMMRLMRSTMLDVLDSEYIKLARIKGLKETTVILKHAMRNAIITPITIGGLMLAGIVGGSLITENIFVIPGMGRLMVESTFGRDFPVVQAIAVIVAVMVLGMNFLVDVAYGWIDPQIRYERN
jgi:ABC-type dipeptide/oligopeptide/nickel transport system permease component